MEEPPKIDSTVGLVIEPPSSKSPQKQDHLIEGYESEEHNKPIKEPENYVTSEKYLWGERILSIGE
jgi:hypothetical protein